jgi:hypothetical protein
MKVSDRSNCDSLHYLAFSIITLLHSLRSWILNTYSDILNLCSFLLVRDQASYIHSKREAIVFVYILILRKWDMKDSELDVSKLSQNIICLQLSDKRYFDMFLLASNVLNLLHFCRVD